MNILLSALINHFLSVAEHNLINSEPEIVAAIENELKLLVNKIENLLALKSSSLATIINPLLDNTEVIANNAIEAAGNAAIGKSTPQSSD